MGAEKALRKRAAALFTLSCILLPLFFCLPVKAHAASAGFSAALSPLEGEAKDRVELTVSYGGGQSELGAFLLRVEYNDAAFEYLRAEEGELLEDGSVTVLPGENSVSACCVTKESVVPEGTALTLLFKVKEDAPAGEADFLVSVSQAADREGSRLEGAELPLAFTVLPPPSAEATLTALKPSLGELTPAFSPNCYDYDMSVPFSVTSIDFTTEAAEGAVCRVNRKNLGAGGSDTDFLLTVTAADGKTKSAYKVTVHRAEKPTPSPKPAASVKPTPTPKPASDVSQGSAHTVRTPAPKKTPRPKATKKPSPSPTSTAEADTGPSVGGRVQPSVVIYNGYPSAGPIAAAIAVMTASFLLSGPLSNFLSKRFARKKENREEEKDDENKHDPNV